MAQADYVISPNPTGLAMRTEVNQIFQAILTNNAGSVAPTTTQAGMFWGDISNALTYYLKIRNHTNDGWVSLYAYDVATKTISPVNTPAGNISSTTVQGAINELDTEKQATLVSGTNIKTVNSTSLLGSGNVAVQPTLVSGTNIKTINSTTLLGSGDVNITSLIVSDINNSTSKTTPVDADELALLDSGTSFSLKKLTFANLKTTLSSLFAPLASPALTDTPTLNGGALVKLSSDGLRIEKANDATIKNQCTAWVNFDGNATPPTIRDSFNVSSVVRTATGIYEVYFATPMDNTNWSSSVLCNSGGTYGAFAMSAPSVTNKQAIFIYGTNMALTNAGYIQFSSFGGKN